MRISKELVRVTGFANVSIPKNANRVLQLHDGHGTDFGHVYLDWFLEEGGRVRYVWNWIWTKYNAHIELSTEDTDIEKALDEIDDTWMDYRDEYEDSEIPV